MTNKPISDETAAWEDFVSYKFHMESHPSEITVPEFRLLWQMLGKKHAVFVLLQHNWKIIASGPIPYRHYPTQNN